MIHEFRLSPSRTDGVSCDAGGAFVGATPILKRRQEDGKDAWQPRDCEELSEQIGSSYGLPIDMSAKRGGLRAIANALNDGNVARAQIATVLLGIPDRPQKGDRSRERMIKLIRDLHWSGMLKWDPNEHPRWPAGSSDSKGGEFAPKGEGDETGASPLPQPSGRAGQTASYDLETPRPGRSATVQLADAAISDASDDPMVEAAARAAAAARLDTMSWQGRLNVINGLQADLAAAIYRVRGDIRPLQEVK